MAVSEAGYVGAVRLEDGALNLAAALDAEAVRRTGLAATADSILRESGSDGSVALKLAFDSDDSVCRGLRLLLSSGS